MWQTDEANQGIIRIKWMNLRHLISYDKSRVLGGSCQKDAAILTYVGDVYLHPDDPKSLGKFPVKS